jgi:hypothetical protein
MGQKNKKEMRRMKNRHIKPQAEKERYGVFRLQLIKLKNGGRRINIILLKISLSIFFISFSTSHSNVQAIVFLKKNLNSKHKYYSTQKKK